MTIVRHCSKNAQIGMMEMIMVLVVIMVLLIIGLLFYSKFSTKSLQQTGERIDEDKAAVIISTINKLPEVECTELGGAGSRACVDTLKLFVLSTKERLKDETHRKHYADTLGYKAVVFEQLYPVAENKDCSDPSIFQAIEYPEAPPTGCRYWTIYNNTKPGDKVFRDMPVALYYPTTGAYTIGRVLVYMPIGS